MGVVLEQTEAGSLIRLEGSIDIACAADLKKLLAEALASTRPPRISLDSATYLDVTAVQLLWAAAREAVASGADFARAGSMPEPVFRALADAGLSQLALFE